MRENCAVIFFHNNGENVHQLAADIEDAIRRAGCRHVLTKFSTRHLIISAANRGGGGVEE